MSDAFVIGTYSTRFGKLADRSYRDLTREAYVGVLEDSGLGGGDAIDMGWFSNTGMGLGPSGQENIRGQCCFVPLVEEGLFPIHAPLVNVEGACASGSLALHGACKDIWSGQCEVSLAIGVEKMTQRDLPALLKAFEEGTCKEDLARLVADYQAAAGECGRPFELGRPGHTMFMDTYALQACWHMWKWGTTQRHLAVAASKNHYHGSLNPKAQYRFEVPVDKVLADYEVSYPLTRSMCAPIGDGAAAALVCSERFLRSLPDAVRTRAVRVRASILANGSYRSMAEPSLSQWAARKAYRAAGLGPKDVHVAEVHDATSFCEIYQMEMLGFCPIGQGGPFVESGASMLRGRLPVNTSGGLVSKGHPIGATGLSMIQEIVTQLRGEAGPRQVVGARVGLSQNGGGVIGVEEAVCAVTILDKP